MSNEHLARALCIIIIIHSGQALMLLVFELDEGELRLEIEVRALEFGLLTPTDSKDQRRWNEGHACRAMERTYLQKLHSCCTTVHTANHFAM